MKLKWWVGFCLIFVLGLTGNVARVHAQGHDDHDRHDDRDHHDGDRFDDHDRQAMREWQEHHHDHPPVGFRNRDRLPPDLESRFQAGLVLGPEYRSRIRPVPVDLYRRLTPPPPGYRYVVVGDHICLVDRGYRVHDVIHFELNF